MNISELSIKNPVFAWMLMLALMVFGYLSFSKMGVSQLPDVDLPVVNVNVIFDGAAPEIMEADIIDPIESAVVAIEGVKNITSSARIGQANISIEFDLNKNIDVAVQEVEMKINQASRNLPKDINPPVVTKVNPEDRPIMWLAVSAENMEPKDLMAYVRDNIKDQFQTISGVADIFLGGYVDPNVRIWADQQKLNQNQLTVTDLIQTIQSEHQELPSGFLNINNDEVNIRTLGEVTSIEQLKEIPLLRRGGTPNYIPLKLKDVADIEEGTAEVRRMSRVMGQTAIGLGIRKQRGSNAVAVAKAVKAKMLIVEKNLPPGLTIGVNFDTTKFIEDSVHELQTNMILASILTAIVCWFFLGSWKATINVILAIPTSILGSFMILKYFNFTLNTFTLLGLSLAIGIVVDDSIMVLENIYRHRDLGLKKRDASLVGAKEITFAALAATVAIMAIFIPVTQMSGVIGKYFFQFGVTISVAVFISYIEALSLTPMRTSQMMESHEQLSWINLRIESLIHQLTDFYKSSLKFALRFRLSVLVFSVLFFALSFLLLKQLPKEFVPAQDTSSFLVRIKTKDSSSLQFTSEVTKQVEDYFKSRPEVTRFFVAIGGFGGGESSTANLFVTLKQPSERKLSQQELLPIYREDLKMIKGGRAFIQDTSQSGIAGGGRGFPIEFSIIGGNWQLLSEKSKLIIKDMEETGLFTDIDSDLKENTQELHLIPKRNDALAKGISIQDINLTISALYGSLVVGKFSKDAHRNDIRIQIKNKDEKTPKDFEKIFVRNIKGELIPLRDVVEFKIVNGMQSITRKSRSRAITIFAGLAPKKSQAEALDQAKMMAQKHLPAGYQVLESGSSETFRESFRDLIFALILGVIVSYMILGSQFNSFTDPIIILMSLPFSITGGLLALWLSGQSINIYSMIGFILLMGLVKKNSILLVDFANQRRREGLNVYDSLMDASPKRLRPILMTTVSTVAGALPLAFAVGAGSENLAPMAQAVIGGSLVSTLLTLYVIPCLYSYKDFSVKSAHSSNKV